ncbi:hypothetical protein DXG01_011234 [Tephrocybe rancida]|nr:hypothetical protein DXG01_011234 [Tephrocybe rancida]
MSQQLHYHHSQAQYVHYTGPPGTHIPTQIINGNTGIAPQDTTHHHQQTQQLQQLQLQQQQQAGTSTPLVATGDWTKDLVHLAKTAELKKHALTLQLHTAHILSAHASLTEKSKMIQDIREQRNKLESERTKLLNALREINEDRDRADLAESTIEREFVPPRIHWLLAPADVLFTPRCNEIRSKMNFLTDGEYAVAKNDVDRLRQELGQPPLPNLQTTLDEKTSQYLNERRLIGNESQNSSSVGGAGTKRSSEPASNVDAPSSKRPRGRPKGSKNRNKEAGGAAAGSSGSVM